MSREHHLPKMFKPRTDTRIQHYLHSDWSITKNIENTTGQDKKIYWHNNVHLEIKQHGTLRATNIEYTSFSDG